MSRTVHHLPYAPLARHLGVNCWCEAEIVRVPAVDVRAGTTRTCGRPDCIPDRSPPEGLNPDAHHQGH